ncbi:MAG: efflux RND transporter permease subunit, partial [Phycisphaeraceae bacterium]|nr:efflux RND transporter permease subunit [Phycisphaeraceae bacterium]
MDVIRFSIENPVKVTVGVLLLLLFGVVSLFVIPVQLTPNVDQPVITIETEWSGRSPEELEREVIEEQEDKLKGVSSVRKMTATANSGSATIELEFYVGTDMSRAVQEVSDSLREVPEYPDEVDEPVITVADAASERAIAWMVLTTEDPDFPIDRLFDAVDKRVKPYLERVDGVAEINIYGGRERQVQIRIDPVTLAQRGITFTQLRQALQLENVNVSAGDLSDGRLDVRIRTVGQYDRLEEIRDTVVVETAGGPLRIRDIAEVVLTLEKRRSFVRSRGRPAIALNAIRESGSNVIEVMNGLRERVKHVREEMLPRMVPEDVDAEKIQLDFEQVYDETVYIYDALNLVRNNLWIGGTLAVLMLLLFLRSVRPTLIVGLAIPVSVIGTFVAMVAFGRNLNVISLAGLAFAVGMVIDNAIVVLENIDRHLHLAEEKDHPREAAYRGTKEVWGAILSSTLTTVAVFLPVLTIEEEAGQLFRDIALAIAAAVVLSLLVSVTVIPTASARLLKNRGQEEGRLARWGKNLLGLTGWMRSATDRWASWIYALAGPTPGAWLARVGVVVAFTFVSLGGAWLLMPPTAYLPRGNRNLVIGFMRTPPAYSTRQNESIAYRVEEGIAPYWQAETMADTETLPPAMVGRGPGAKPMQVPPIDNFFFVSRGPRVFMGASSRNKQLVSPLAA